MPRRRSFWIVQSREARVHAAIVAAVLWTLALVILVIPGPRDVFGNLKGTDFVQFYALGDAALARDGQGLYDPVAIHARQVRLVPASAADKYLPIYPPHAGLLFSLFSRIGYGWAVLAWMACTVAVYWLCVRAAWRAVSRALPDGWFVALAAAAFPPFWNLVLHGQTSAVPLLAFTAGGLAFARGHRFAAGVWLGLLAIKPQLAIPIAVVCIVTAQGRLIAGAILAVTLQWLAASMTFGWDVWMDYARVVAGYPGLMVPEPRPSQLHSIRALTGMLPEPAGLVLWLCASAAVIWMLCLAWRRSPSPLFAFGLMVFAAVLVSPHLLVYDATVLFPAALWVGAWMTTASGSGSSMRPERYWSLAYWTGVAFLAPTAWLVGVQASVVLLSALFFTAAAAVVSRRATADPGK